MADYPTTRAAAMALGDERRLVQQGYEFLDEKRMLLATEIMRQLAAWKAARERHAAAMETARRALGDALRRHGLEGLQVYPAVETEPGRVRLSRQSFLGVMLVRVAVSDEPDPPARPAVDPSTEAELCAAAFRALTPIAAEMAAASGNLARLAVEYRRTERRARALENVLLPEITDALKAIDEQLEVMDQEEAIRVRLADR